ncbi:LysR substrate-binding domain-containing protein [Vogesella sp. GCM10023246]|uniref:LysR substrate-binding domain-containing protein n=1 Tax=Vogesella oryzagri TaxID=3160864 RepID=A0ABV1M6J9_9NEIS
MREENSLILRDLPSLNCLRVFEAAARWQSFVRAADELCVTHGAVSRQVRQLELQLGVALFERRNRAVFLTQAGQQLLSGCSEALATLATTLAAVRAQPAVRPLVLSCEPTLAMRWLIPRLPRWQQRAPELPLHLLAAGGAVDFVRTGVDAALRRNDFAWGSDCHAEAVAPELMAAVCAVGASPEQGALLHSLSRPQAWPRWQALGKPLPPCPAQQRFEHFYLSLQAAQAGVGYAQASLYMVVDELRAGRLAAPYGALADGSHYVLLCASGRQQEPALQRLLAWLREEMQLSREQLQGVAGLELPAS